MLCDAFWQLACSGFLGAGEPGGRKVIKNVHPDNVVERTSVNVIPPLFAFTSQQKPLPVRRSLTAKTKVVVFAKPVIPLRCHGRSRRLLPPIVRSQDAALGMYSSHRPLSASHHPAYLCKLSMKLLVSGHRIYDDHDTTKKFICLDVKLFIYLQNIRNIKKLPSRSIFTMWGIARFFLYEYDLGVKTPERRRTDNKR